MSDSSRPTGKNPYLTTAVLTASPAELRMMLIDAAIRFGRQGREGIAERNYEQAYNGITRCQSALTELIAALDHKADRELCERLESLYLFMYNRLITAGHERNPEIVDEVLGLLEFERETWAMAMQQLADDTAQANATAATTTLDDLLDSVPPPANPGENHHQRLTASNSIIGGTVSIRG